MGAFLKIIIQRSAFLFFEKGDKQMGFFTTSVTGLKTVVTAIGAGVGVWGVINLLEGYGNDNPGATAQLPLSFQIVEYCFQFSSTSEPHI